MKNRGFGVSDYQYIFRKNKSPVVEMAFDINCFIKDRKQEFNAVLSLKG